MLLNRSRANAVMQDQGLDALVATSAENVTYSSGFANWTIYAFKDLEMYVVVPAAGDVVLVAPIDAVDYLAQCPASVSKLYTYGTFHTAVRPNADLSEAEAGILALRSEASHHPNGMTALRHALAEAGVSGGSIGIDERGMPPSRWRALGTALPGTAIHEASEIFRTVRMIKTDDEIERLRYAVRAVEKGMAAAFTLAAPGITEGALEATFRATVAFTGTIPGHFETATGSAQRRLFSRSGRPRHPPRVM